MDFPQDETDLDQIAGMMSHRTGIGRVAVHQALREYYFHGEQPCTIVAQCLAAGAPRVWEMVDDPDPILHDYWIE